MRVQSQETMRGTGSMRPVFRVAATWCLVSTLVIAGGGDVARAQEFGKVTFTCPPCGCSGDTLRVDSAGDCPVCGMQMMERSEFRRVALFVYPGMQLADLAGAYSVFEAARTFEVFTVSHDVRPLSVSFSPVTLTPTYSFENCPKPDILIIPGGGVGRQLNDPRTMSWIRAQSAEARIVLSVCTGAFLLAGTGLLDGLSATVLEEDLDQLRRAAPKVHVVSGKRFVDNGKFITAAGPSTGIDASLHILSRMFGNARRADAIAKFLDYRCPPK